MAAGSSALGHSNASSILGFGIPDSRGSSVLGSITGSVTGSDRHSFTPAPTSLTSVQQEIISLLQIPLHLANRDDHNLRFAYAKYKACLQALRNYQDLVDSGTWTGSSLIQYDIIRLFVSKSFWHSHYVKTFSKLSSFPDMKEWLENTDDLDDEKVWGIKKGSYSFIDLMNIVLPPKLSEKLQEKEDQKQKKKDDKKDVASGSRKILGSGKGASGSKKSASGSGKRKASSGNSPAKNKKKKKQL